MKLRGNPPIWRSSTIARNPHTRGLTLIQYRPPGCIETRTCAAIWEAHERVQLACPLLRKQAGILDPQPFIKKFPCAPDMLETFERAMEWLDSVCYAAQSSAQIGQACEAEPEWGLGCTRYDATDQTLGLGGLGHAWLPDDALLKEVARQCLTQTITRLLKEDPDIQNAQMDLIEAAGNTRDIATVYSPNGGAMRVSLLKKVPRTDVIRRGILAMDRMNRPEATWQHALLVMPGLELEQPIFLSRSVTICSLEFSLVRAALLARLVPVSGPTHLEEPT